MAVEGLHHKGVWVGGVDTAAIAGRDAIAAGV